MLRKILLPRLTNCTSLNIHSSTTIFFSHSSYDYPPEKSSLEDNLKEFMELVGQPIIPVSHEPPLEDTLEAFRKTINQPCQEIIDVTIANTEIVVKLE
jgi:hypothetical protein